MGGPRNVHHIWKTRAGGQSLAVAWACTQSPTLPASRSGSRQPRGSGLRRLDPRPPSLDFPNQPEALATRPATDRRSGAQRPRPSSDEAWQPCAEGRTAGGALVPPSAAPGWAQRVRRKGWGLKTERAAAQEPSGPLLQAVSSSGAAQALPLPHSALQARAGSRLWHPRHAAHPARGTLVGGGLLTCCERDVRFKAPF